MEQPRQIVVGDIQTPSPLTQQTAVSRESRGRCICTMNEWQKNESLTRFCRNLTTPTICILILFGTASPNTDTEKEKAEEQVAGDIAASEDVPAQVTTTTIPASPQVPKFVALSDDAIDAGYDTEAELGPFWDAVADEGDLEEEEDGNGLPEVDHDNPLPPSNEQNGPTKPAHNAEENGPTGNE